MMLRLLEQLEHIPVVALPNTVLFPGAYLPLHVFEPQFNGLIDAAAKTHKLIAVTLENLGAEKDIGACVCGAGEIVHIQDVHGEKRHVVVRGVARIKVTNYRQLQPYRLAAFSIMPDLISHQAPRAALFRELYLLINRWIFLKEEIPDEILSYVTLIRGAGPLADFFAYYFMHDHAKKQQLLETADVLQRMELVRNIVAADIAAMEAEHNQALWH